MFLHHLLQHIEYIYVNTQIKSVSDHTIIKNKKTFNICTYYNQLDFWDHMFIVLIFQNMILVKYD